ncbi:hypothetical protein GGS20DRAFT_511677 [Poronia punctata]|nr:hypothetical protein GGS20DRAFT_511677 [Poronia punctata]
MTAEESCKVCQDPLVVEVEDEFEDENGHNDGTGPQSVPDDLELTCGCHFHWQCLLDRSADVAASLKCPSCQSPLAEASAGPSVSDPSLPTTLGVSILSTYTNEGGVQENLDLAPAITEEAYLTAHPEARPARAFHVMCSEGDINGIVDLLRDIDAIAQEGGEEPTLSPAQLIRYQDPLSDMKSGLHIAIEQGQEEVVWLLLWIASSLRTYTFPAPLREIALAMGLQRPDTVPSDDIRALQTAQGRTAEAMAADREGLWANLLEADVLRPGAP